VTTTDSLKRLFKQWPGLPYQQSLERVEKWTLFQYTRLWCLPPRQEERRFFHVNIYDIGNVMGILSRLFNMPSFNGATNALLVELALPELTEAQRSQLKGRAIDLYKAYRSSDGPPEAVLVELNQMPRIFQLNVLALAMKDLGHQLPLKKERFKKITDPFDPSHADEYALRAVARRLKWHYGVEVWIAEESISFDSW
jgi:hypothetical protein